MATILEFSRSGVTPRETQPASDVVAAGGAEIIIFPGVRYERWDEAPPATGAGADINQDDTLDAAPKPRRRAAAAGRSATAARKKPRAERKRDVLEIPD